MLNRRGGLTMLEVMIAAILLAAVFAMTFVVIWSSSETVSRAEVQVQLEALTRETLNQIVSEIRQTQKGYIKNAGVPLASIQGYPNPAFSDITFRVPAPDPTGTNFSLSAYKNSNASAYTRQIRYFWAPAVNNDSDFNGGKGLLGQGILRKEDQALDVNGNPVGIDGTPGGGPVKSVVCANLQPLPVAGAAGLMKVDLRSSAQLKDISNNPILINGLQFNWDPASPSQVTVTLTLEKLDPKNKNKTIFKQAQANIELRN
jgi:type II secretory pathway pseudopilin PulG